MKLHKLLLRWYRSFHLNYRGMAQKGEAAAYRPWNRISPSFAPDVEFPFIEIPIERDITTIVGANESGKSHLLNAISKVVRGTGIKASDKFRRTDLCHYAGVRTRNVEAWPNIGLQFTLESEEERQAVLSAAGVNPSGPESEAAGFAIILAPEGDKVAWLFVEPAEQPFSLTEKKLNALRQTLPRVQFIDSHALMPSEISLTRLIAAYGDEDLDGIDLFDRRAVVEAVKTIRSIMLPNASQPLPGEWIKDFEGARNKLVNIDLALPADDSLEMLLFRDILGISMETLKFINELPVEERGYTEGQIGKWNEAIDNCLNLSHFWKQDEKFTLTVDYKDGIIYFEIRDKTDSVYTFNERSSGLKFFLSYYIQARAMEISNRHRNSIILMDEPDSALSILGQRNLLAVFESLVSPESSSGTCQLIYTTHSPYLINRNFPRRIRVVKKEDAEEGTQYIERARSRRYEPVRTALGIESASSLFLGAANVLLEGSTDQYLLVELIRVFATPENVGEFLDLNAVVTLSAEGAGNVEHVLAESRWADEPIPPTVVLLDSDEAASNTRDRITSPKKPLIDREFVGMIGEIVSASDDNHTVVSVEDIIPREIYAESLVAYVMKWLPETYESHKELLLSETKRDSFGQAGFVDSTRRLFKAIKPEIEGHYDKTGILQEVVNRATGLQARDMPDPSLGKLKDNIIKICEFIRRGLERSQEVVAKRSVSQAIKRIIHDFKLLNRDNVAVTGLQALFRRIEREAASIGKDGESLLQVTSRLSGELEKLRAAGQERVSKHAWEEWRGRIEKIGKNPLDVD